MRRTEWLTLGAAAVLAIAGTAMALTPAGDASVEQLAPQAGVEDLSSTPATQIPADQIPATDVTEVTETVAAPPPPVPEGLPDSIAQVLAESGFSGMLSRQELEQSLPPSVVSVLIANHATLAVAVDPAPEDVQ